MSTRILTQRYANALKGAATAQQSVSAVAKDLETMLKMSLKEKDVLESPIYSKHDKNQIIASFKVSKTTLGFLNLLLDNQRLGLLNDISNQFLQLISSSTLVTVVSAKPLDLAVKDKLKSLLKNHPLVKSSVDLIEKVDPLVIGGLLLEIDGNTIDATVKSKLVQLNSLISTPI